jgi:hypothetical protein
LQGWHQLGVKISRPVEHESNGVIGSMFYNDANRVFENATLVHGGSNDYMASQRKSWSN